MEQKFASEALPLADLLHRAETGELQLPDFQRGWVWDDDHIRSLLASISLSYPIGAIMTLETGNAEVRFKPRPLEGVSEAPKEPALLLLDGQQRLTSLFLALKSTNPVPTRNDRGKPIGRHYYAKIEKCVDPDADREEEAIISVPEDRVVRADFGRRVELDLSDRDREISAEVFPLDIVLDPGATMDWQMAYFASGAAGEKIERWKVFQEEVIKPFQSCQLPTIRLVKSTRKEAVCQVFEKVNTGGVTLTVFELLTATYAADDFGLRPDWNVRKKTLRQHAVLGRFNETGFLQIVSLLATFERRRRHLGDHPNDDKAPAVSCKRRDILRLPLEDYRRWADTASEGLEAAVAFLHELSVFRSRDLPYTTQLVPLAAILGWLGKDAGLFTVRERLRQWYWCGVFGEMYSGTTETRLANDLLDCIAWVRDEQQTPRTVRDAQFQAERLLSLTTRNSAAYKGLHALQMSRGSRDLLSGGSIDIETFDKHAIDIHHVFPRRWCQQSGDRKILDVAETAVNKTAIGSFANGVVGGNAPSTYLGRLEEKGGMSSPVLDGLLRSHDVDPLALRRDDFASFFDHRFERLLSRIGVAMGKPVNRSENRDESPFFDSDGSRAIADIERLIRGGESRTVEFKSTGRCNLHTKEKDPAMEWAVARTICAFMNTSGGTLLVGVGDAGKVLGIEADYPFVKPRDRDGWELWLTDLVKKIAGQVAATDLEVRFVVVNGSTVARIGVRPGIAPVFATPMKGDRKPVFFARVGNATQEMSGSELLEYTKKQWSE